MGTSFSGKTNPLNIKIAFLKDFMWGRIFLQYPNF
jgi:hypothetical protein